MPSARSLSCRICAARIISSSSETLLPLGDMCPPARSDSAGAPRSEAVPINRPAQNAAIHGFGRAAPWTVAEEGPSRLVLRQSFSAAGIPYAYEAEQIFALSSESSVWTLRVVNRGSAEMPFGIGFHQTGGSIQSAYDGVLSKRLGPGFAARDAVTAAFLAADGLTGTREILDGKAGFFNLFLRGDATPVRMVERLGESWEIDAFSFKPYPGCRCHHATIGVALDLRREGLQPEQVKAVGVGLGETNWHMVGKPYDASLDSTVHAQFNAAYSFARALCDGRVGPRAYERPAITESRVVALAERIRVSVDARIEKNAMAPVHVRVELVDGSIIAQLGITDMRHAIQYALTYPDRLESPCGYLDLLQAGPLEFHAPDLEQFPSLRLAYGALRAGGTYPAALNAANEVAVASFLEGSLDFLGIPRVVEEVLEAHGGGPADSIDAVLAADLAARERARETVSHYAANRVR